MAAAFRADPSPKASPEDHEKQSDDGDEDGIADTLCCRVPCKTPAAKEPEVFSGLIDLIGLIEAKPGIGKLFAKDASHLLNLFRREAFPCCLDDLGKGSGMAAQVAFNEV
jgi:hypothetical protein